MGDILLYVMGGFALAGALDRIFGSKLGLGKEFEKGILTMGELALAMIGIITLAPVLANLLRPVVVPVYGFLGADPAMFAGTILACDMGGGALAAELTQDAQAAILGGLITAFYSLIGGYSNGIYREIDSLSFLIICVLSALFALLYSLICRKRIDIRSAEIRIKIGKDFVRARLLCDSGNLVTEPFSALPVIVLSSTCLPPPYDNPESELFPQTIRAIPFSTSSGAGCFFGFRPERIELLRPARKPKLIDAYIGIDTERKSYSGYDGLIPTSVL